MNDLQFDIPSGRYVVAVSGGVDSMVLLDALTKRLNVSLIVAHLDHGIRPDSSEDRLLVQKIAKSHNLPFVFNKVNLGTGTSESEARRLRYDFLDIVRKASNAQAIITAHHQDDLIETAIHNVLRGTNRKGLNSLKSTSSTLRPLTHVSKADIYKYAKLAKLEWREDITNKDIKYKRNYIRHNIITKLSPHQREQFVSLLSKTAVINTKIDEEVNDYLDEHTVDNKFSRYYFNILPHSVALEMMASWLRRNGVGSFDSKLLDRLTIGAKTLSTRQRIDVNTAVYLEVNQDILALMHREC